MQSLDGKCSHCFFRDRKGTILCVASCCLQGHDYAVGQTQCNFTRKGKASCTASYCEVHQAYHTVKNGNEACRFGPVPARSWVPNARVWTEEEDRAAAAAAAAASAANRGRGRGRASRTNAGDGDGDSAGTRRRGRRSGASDKDKATTTRSGRRTGRRSANGAGGEGGASSLDAASKAAKKQQFRRQALQGFEAQTGGRQ